MLYTHPKLLLSFKEHFRKIQGIKLIKKGYIKEIPKLINVFLIKII